MTACKHMRIYLEDSPSAKSAADCLGRTALFLLILPFLLLSGCSTVFDARKQKEEIIAGYVAGNYAEAIELADEKISDREGTGDELMWRLEEGTLKFDDEKYDASLAAFDRAEAIVADFDSRADANVRRAGAEAGSAVTNPNALPYKGLNSDRIMLHIYKFLDYAAKGDSSGAMVELRRMRDRQKTAEKELQDEIAREQEDIAKANEENKQNSQGQESTVDFASLGSNERISQSMNEMNSKVNNTYSACLNPFAVYLSALGYLYDGNPGEADFDFRRLMKMVPDNSLVRRSLVTCSSEIGSEIPEDLKDVKPFDFPMNQGSVYVIFANGRGAALRQVKIDLILPFVGYTGFAYPELEYFPAPFQNLKVSSGDLVLNTEIVADMDAIISQEYSLRLPGIITRIAISTITKEVASAAAVYAAKQAGGVWGMAGAYVGTGIYKYMFNTADTRCWETLPKNFQACLLKMPESGSISISPCFAEGVVAEPKTFDVKLDKKRKIAIVYVKSQASDVFLVRTFYLD